MYLIMWGIEQREWVQPAKARHDARNNTIDMRRCVAGCGDSAVRLGT